MTMNTPSAAAGCRRSHAFRLNHFLFLLRNDPRFEKVRGNTDVAPQDKSVPSTQDVIVCRQCLHVITSPAERKVVHGSHAHTFANPEGIIFEISCFRDAWGCGYVGPASPEFTWFAGYLWRICVCANCHVHLGWRFSSPDGHFFHGLITSRLIGRDVGPAHGE
jgi:hypothetical protein